MPISPHAKLRGADLLGANLEGANFTGAKLQGADLVESEGLTQEQLKFACGDAETKLPRGISIALCPEQQEEQRKLDACRRASLRKTARR